MESNPEYSIVIPVFNSEDSLKQISARINYVFSETLESSYELIFIDDSSSNTNTWKVLAELVDTGKNVEAVRLTRNFGQQAATICGIRIAKGDYVITMDDDLQHLPEDIPALISQRHHDVVLARFEDKNHGVTKRFFSWAKGFCDQIILDKPKNVQFSPFRLINRSTINSMVRLFDTPYPFLPAIILFVTKDIVGVKVMHGVRHDGDTGYDIIKMIRLFSNLLINNSSLLLSLIGNLGLIISLLSFLLGFYFIYRKLIYSIDVVGWTSVIVTVLFIGGLLLFSIGIIGEYLIRIIRGVDKRPNYIIRDHIKTVT